MGQRNLLILFIVQWEYYMGVNALIYSHSTVNAWNPYYVLGTVPVLGHRVARTAGEGEPGWLSWLCLLLA